jgi:hypothetical protein
MYHQITVDGTGKRIFLKAVLFVLLVLAPMGCLGLKEVTDQKESDIVTRQNEYSEERLLGFAAKARQVEELYLTQKDIIALVAMMADEEPWIRLYVASNLQHRTNLVEILVNPSFREFDPWGKTAVIEQQVAEFKKQLTGRLGEVVWNSSAFSKDDMESIRKSQTDHEMLLNLKFMARNMLLDGDKRGIYALIGLIDCKSFAETSRALALHQLIRATRPDMMPQHLEDGVKKSIFDSSNLSSNYYLGDKVLLEKIKQEWLAWWKENGDTFELKAAPPDLGPGKLLVR